MSISDRENPNLHLIYNIYMPYRDHGVFKEITKSLLDMQRGFDSQLEMEERHNRLQESNPITGIPEIWERLVDWYQRVYREMEQVVSYIISFNLDATVAINNLVLIMNNNQAKMNAYRTRYSLSRAYNNGPGEIMTMINIVSRRLGIEPIYNERLFTFGNFAGAPRAPVAPVAARAPVAPVAARAPVAPVAARAPVAAIAPILSTAAIASIASRVPIAYVAPVASRVPIASVAQVVSRTQEEVPSFSDLNQTEKNKLLEGYLKKLTCSVCLTNEVNTVLTPCGHLLCSGCSTNIIRGENICPKCRQRIIGTNNIYYQKYLKYKNKYAILKNEILQK